MLKWGSARRNSAARQGETSAAAHDPGSVSNGSGSSFGTISSLAGGGAPGSPRRGSRGNAALEALRGRVRSTSVATSPAHRAAVSATNHTRTDSGPPPRTTTTSHRRAAEEVLLDRQAIERLQTSSAPAALRSATPPPYAQHSLDRSPLPNPLVLDDRPRVPPPIYLRCSSNQPQSKLGTLTIHLPGWGVTLVRPPRAFDLHPLEAGSSGREPPAEDTVLSGAIEVVMRERRRVQAISVGVQSVARLNLGQARGWEEDGIFERGVEILGGEPDTEGIWLEKGSQSFSFSILLPATLATHDFHNFGRISYIITARVAGIPDSSGRLGSMFKSREIPIQGECPYYGDFLNVIARSARLAEEQEKAGSRGWQGSPLLAPVGLQSADYEPSPLSTPMDEAAIAFPGVEGTGAAAQVRGLYHRRSSADLIIPLPSNGANCRPSPLRNDTDTGSTMSRQSSSEGTVRGERTDWLTGDICAVRNLKIHANPSPTTGSYQLDITKEGYVEGLGPWRFSAQSDNFTIASVMLLNLSILSPSPTCTIFFVRIILSQNYALHSPRTPNDPPFKPEQPKNHLIYQVGRPHRHGESVLGHDVDALYRGPQAGGRPSQAPAGGWKTRAIARLPNHEKIRPSTNPGTITPIRVSHEILVRIFYSIEGETVAGRKVIRGPGEVRMCQVRLPITVPSCSCGTATLNLPTYASAIDPASIMPDSTDFDHRKLCQCGATFAELTASAIRKKNEDEDGSSRVGPGTGKGREAAADAATPEPSGSG